MEESGGPNHVATPPWHSPSQDSEGEGSDVVTDMEPATRIKRMRTLLGRVSEQGPRVMPSLDLAATGRFCPVGPTRLVGPVRPTRLVGPVSLIKRHWCNVCLSRSIAAAERVSRKQNVKS